jgi:leucyl aminopeptidase (aminopeptidase T)
MGNWLLENARIVVEVSCRAKPDESVVILTSGKELAGRGWVYARALAAAALALGAVPTIVDISDLVSSRLYQRGGVLKPVESAIEAADIVILVSDLRYSDLLGDPDAHDRALTAEQRRVYLQSNGMEEWQITPGEAAAIRKRTMWLRARLSTSREVHVSSPAGTDFRFGLGEGANWIPILGIVPLYGEVAVIPRQGSSSGVFVVDGPTQMGVRTNDELDREPLRVTIEGGRVKAVSGDTVQVGRLRAFIASGDPAADTIDEIGILTTSIEANDRYWWADGTHHHDCAHIALGNNRRRDVLVHGPRHMDGEVRKPTISVDGLVVVDNGAFLDRVVEGSGP